MSQTDFFEQSDDPGLRVRRRVAFVYVGGAVGPSSMSRSHWACLFDCEGQVGGWDGNGFEPTRGPPLSCCSSSDAASCGELASKRDSSPGISIRAFIVLTTDQIIEDSGAPGFL
jgi:hypothetical protein